MKKIIVKNSTVDGVGLFADEPFLAGEKILTIQAPIVQKKINTPEESENIKNWIGVGKDRWIVTDDTPFRFINHSCNPNTALYGKKLIALLDIAPNDEVTIDYSMTDADPYWVMPCSCGSASCRGEIKSIYSVPKEVFRNHLKHVSKPFQRIFIENYVDLVSKHDKFYKYEK